MNVNSYTIANVHRDGAPPPRVWRISTDGGVVWLAEDGGRSRLIQLPLPHGARHMGAQLDDTQHDPCEALALTAETEAAGRWVRAVPTLTEQPAAQRDP